MSQSSKFRFPKVETILNGILLASLAVATGLSAVIANLPTPVA